MGNYPPANNASYMQQQPPPPAANTYWQPPAAAQEQLEKETLDHLKSELDEADTMDEKAVDQLAKKVSELTTTEEPIEKEEQQQQQQQRRPRYDNNQQRGRGRGGYRQYNKNFVIPNSEFDFEASNAKFDKKSEVAEEQDEKESEVEVPEPEEFYDKVKKTSI
jgi:protein LSM14